MEDKCKRCGTCCYLTFYDDKGNKLKTDMVCKHLTKDNLCSIYNNRPSWCLTAQKMEELNLLPLKCGYRR